MATDGKQDHLLIETPHPNRVADTVDFAGLSRGSLSLNRVALECAIFLHSGGPEKGSFGTRMAVFLRRRGLGCRSLIVYEEGHFDEG